MKPTRPAASSPSALILAIEPDKKQATKIAKLSRELPDTEWVIADSVQRALQELGQRVPNLILTSLLLSPRDEAALTDRLRELETAASHVQTLVIPVLGTASRSRAGSARGLLKRLTGAKEKPANSPDGCDPAIFAAQIKEYLERAAADREHAKAVAEEVPAQQVQLYGDAWEAVRAVAPLEPPADSRVRSDDLRSALVGGQEELHHADEVLTVDPPAGLVAEPAAAPYDLGSSVVFDRPVETSQPLAEPWGEPAADHTDPVLTRGWDEPAASSIEETAGVDQVIQAVEEPPQDEPAVPSARFVYQPLFTAVPAASSASIVKEPVFASEPIVKKEAVEPILDKAAIVEDWPSVSREPTSDEEPIVSRELVDDSDLIVRRDSIIGDSIFRKDAIVNEVDSWQEEPSRVEMPSVFMPAAKPAAVDPALFLTPTEDPTAEPEDTWSAPELASFEVVQDDVVNDTIRRDVTEKIDGDDDLDFERALAEETVSVLKGETPESDSEPMPVALATDPWADIVAAASGRSDAESETDPETTTSIVRDEPLSVSARPLDLAADLVEPIVLPDEEEPLEWQEALSWQAPLAPHEPERIVNAPEPTTASPELEAFMNELTRKDERSATAASAPVVAESSWTSVPDIEPALSWETATEVDREPVPEVPEPIWSAAPSIDPEPLWTPPTPAPVVQAPPAAPAPASQNLEVIEMLTAIRRDLEQLREERANVTSELDLEEEAGVEADLIGQELREPDPEPEHVVAPPPPSRPVRSRTSSAKGKAKPKHAPKAAAKAPAKPRKKAPPIQDEWGFFDPDQCGFAALLAKLKEIEDDGPTEED